MMKGILALSFIAFLASCGGGDTSNATGPQLNGTDVLSASSGSAESSGSSDSSVAVDSRAFLVAAFQDGLGEITLSELALQKTSDGNVKKFAQRMIDDHTQANNEIRQLAQAKNIALPSDTSAEQKAVLENLSKLSGVDFDRAYMDHNVTVHEKDVSLFRTQAMSGTDADVKTFAANTLPVLQAHLLAAKTINGTINPTAFLKNVFVDGKAEILLSTLALEKATSPDTRAFAQRMIDDHTRVNNEIMQLAQAKSISLPTDITVEHKAAYEDISKMSGADFEKAYMNHNVLVHASGVAQAREQSKQGTDADIRAFAGRTLPVLSMHLQTATAIYEKIMPSLLFSAFQDGTGEILLSKLALQKTADAEVRQFAQRMIDDHTRVNNEIRQLAQKKNVTLPYEISAGQLRDYVDLSQLSGREFDTAYMDRNVTVHEEDVQHFQERAANETDPDIRAFATATLPVLSAHLAAARQIDSRLKGA